MTGSELLKVCDVVLDDTSTWENTADIERCIGYLEGWLGADELRSFDEVAGDSFVCLPFGETLDQIRAMVVKYIKDSPSKRHWNASTLMVGALGSGEFACSAE